MKLRNRASALLFGLCLALLALTLSCGETDTPGEDTGTPDSGPADIAEDTADDTMDASISDAETGTDVEIDANELPSCPTEKNLSVNVTLPCSCFGNIITAEMVDGCDGIPKCCPGRHIFVCE